MFGDRVVGEEWYIYQFPFRDLSKTMLSYVKTERQSSS